MGSGLPLPASPFFDATIGQGMFGNGSSIFLILVRRAQNVVRGAFLILALWVLIGVLKVLFLALSGLILALSGPIPSLDLRFPGPVRGVILPHKHGIGLIGWCNEKHFLQINVRAGCGNAVVVTLCWAPALVTGDDG